MKSRKKNDSKVTSNLSSSAYVGKNDRTKQFSVLPLFPAAPQPQRCSRIRLSSTLGDLTLHNAGDIIMAPCNTIIMQTTIDGKIQISRTQKEIEKNPDRLSLDRRGLSQFPILIGEVKLRLLSLQHNLLSQLEKSALLCLPYLVFLDIYNNQLENMAALECLYHLRVLLLGKNRIKFIEGLSNMDRLEVLDLHGNQIAQISNLRNQKELKVLNLASNEIQCIYESDLDGLITLQELNLRRNFLKKLSGFAETSQLLKLFLSNNCITTYEDLNDIKKLQRLKEITLEGNPIHSSENCLFFIASYIPSVLLFGQTRITEDIRKASKVWRLRNEFRERKEYSFSFETDPSTDANSNVNQMPLESRNHPKQWRKQAVGKPKLLNRNISGLNYSAKSKVITKAEKAKRVAFIKRKPVSVDSCYGSDTSGEYFRLPPILTSSVGDDGGVVLRVDPNTSMESNKSFCSIRDENSSSSDDLNENSTSSESEEKSPPVTDNPRTYNSIPSESALKNDDNYEKAFSPTKSVTSTSNELKMKNKSSFLNEKTKEQGSDYLVQISGRFLTITGRNSAKYIDKAWNVDKASDVTTVKFICVSFNTLVPIFNRLKYRFPNAKHFIFSENDFNYVGQLNAFTNLGGLVSLDIHAERNLIVTKNWRSYAIFRLHHWGLQIINNIPITEEEVKQAKEEYNGLSELILFSLPESLLTPLLSKLRLEINTTSAKQWLCQVDPAIRSVICKEALKWRSPASLSKTDNHEQEKGRQTLISTLKKASAMVMKLKKLEKEWDVILRYMVENTLKDYNMLENNLNESRLERD